MNWVIRNTEKIKFQTNLNVVLKPIWNDLIEYNWILTDLDFMSDDEVPINFDYDYFVLNNEQFRELYESDTQIIWGIISAFPKNSHLNTDLISILSAEDQKVWRPDTFIISESILEVIAFDSSYTIVKFKDEKLSSTFKDYFQEEAIDLQEFIEKNIK